MSAVGLWGSEGGEQHLAARLRHSGIIGVWSLTPVALQWVRSSMCSTACASSSSPSRLITTSVTLSRPQPPSHPPLPPLISHATPTLTAYSLPSRSTFRSLPHACRLILTLSRTSYLSLLPSSQSATRLPHLHFRSLLSRPSHPPIPPYPRLPLLLSSLQGSAISSPCFEPPASPSESLSTRPSLSF